MSRGLSAVEGFLWYSKNGYDIVISDCGMVQKAARLVETDHLLSLLRSCVGIPLIIPDSRHRVFQRAICHPLRYEHMLLND